MLTKHDVYAIAIHCYFQNGRTWFVRNHWPYILLSHF